jgi:hypothetical protein
MLDFCSTGVAATLGSERQIHSPISTMKRRHDPPVLEQGEQRQQQHKDDHPVFGVFELDLGHVDLRHSAADGAVIETPLP